jgi:hypothetical protein
MNRVNEIDARIADLQRQYDDVEGTPTEIYTRIVGYYRSLKNWNLGKREEYDHRLTFTGKPAIDDQAKDQEHGVPADPTCSAAGDSSYLYFFRRTCPNCPPVQDEIEGSGLPGEKVDVDTSEGIAQAIAYQVLSTPTVVLLNTDGTVRAKLSSLEQVRAMLQTVA